MFSLQGAHQEIRERRNNLEKGNKMSQGTETRRGIAFSRKSVIQFA